MIEPFVIVGEIIVGIEKHESRTIRFAEALSKGASDSFKKLASEILKEGALSAKEKALIGLACSVAVRCEYCAKKHQQDAILAGATKEEILEAAAVAGLVRMGSGFNTAAILLDDLDKEGNYRKEADSNV